MNTHKQKQLCYDNGNVQWMMICTDDIDIDIDDIDQTYTPHNGIVINYYDNGNMWGLSTWRDGHAYGKSFTYFTSGEIQSEYDCAAREYTYYLKDGTITYNMAESCFIEDDCMFKYSGETGEKIIVSYMLCQDQASQN